MSDVFVMYDKNNYIEHIRTLKQILNHGLILKKVHKVIRFNQKAWLNSYISSEQKQKMILRQTFLKLMNNAVFGKLENVRKTQRY